MTAVRHDPRYPRAAGLLFLALTCFYLLFTGGHIYTPGGVAAYRVTEAIAERGELSIEHLLELHDHAERDVGPGLAESRFFSRGGLGLSLAALPAYKLGDALLPLLSAEERELFYTPATVEGNLRFDRPRPTEWRDDMSFRRLWYEVQPHNYAEAFRAFLVSLLNSSVTAMLAVVLLFIARELGYSLRAGLAASLAAGLATPLWHYAQTFLPEPLAGLLFAACLLSLLRARRGRGWLWLALAGLSLGLLGLTKQALLILALPALALLVHQTRDRSVGARAAALAWVAAWAAPGVAATLAYNNLRFGAPFLASYPGPAGDVSVLSGLASLLFSPGRGLLVFCPAVLVAAAATPAFRRRNPGVSDTLWLSLAAVLLIYARRSLGEGVWSWGPRSLVPVLGPLMLPIAAWIDAPPRPEIAKAARAVVGLSLLVALSGHLVNFHDYHQWGLRYYQENAEDYRERGVESYHELVRWDWRWSPVLRYWSFPMQETMLWPRAIGFPGVTRSIYLGGLLTLLLSASSLSFLNRGRGAGGPGPATPTPGSGRGAAPRSRPPAPAAPPERGG